MLMFFPHGLSLSARAGMRDKNENKQGLLIILLTQKQEEAQGAGVLLLQEIGILTLHRLRRISNNPQTDQSINPSSRFDRSLS